MIRSRTHAPMNGTAPPAPFASMWGPTTAPMVAFGF